MDVARRVNVLLLSVLSMAAATWCLRWLLLAFLEWLGP
jgi:hypothetical protein